MASHSDFPSYKLKPHPTIKDIKNKYTKLNTEGYGGMIAYSWFDRPLGIAGRIFVESENKIKEILVNLDETIVIPSWQFISIEHKRITLTLKLICCHFLVVVINHLKRCY